MKKYASGWGGGGGGGSKKIWGVRGGWILKKLGDYGGGGACRGLAIHQALQQSSHIKNEFEAMYTQSFIGLLCTKNPEIPPVAVRNRCLEIWNSTAVPKLKPKKELQRLFGRLFFSHGFTEV